MMNHFNERVKEVEKKSQEIIWENLSVHDSYEEK